MLRPRLLLSWLISVGLVLSTAPAASATPGDLDPSFGQGGFTRLLSSPIEDAVLNLAFQPDGKILAVGWTGRATNHDFLLARLLPNGQLDPSFGHSGIVTTDFFGSYDTATGVAARADGKIVVGGSVTEVVNSSLQVYPGVARYLPDGSLDPTFGQGGKAVNGAVQMAANAMALSRGGKILLGGSTISTGMFAVARFRVGGHIDAAFGQDGEAIVDMGSYGQGLAVGVQSSGRIIIGGFAGTGGASDVAVAGLTPAGDLDPSFGIDGLVTEVWPKAAAAHAMVLQPDGRILLAGESGPGVGIARLTADGILDPTFSGDGRKKVAIEPQAGTFTYSVNLQGRNIIVAGQNGNQTFLARLGRRGKLDSTFGDGGVAMTAVPEVFVLSEVKTDAGGKLVGAGRIASTVGALSDPVVARFLGA